MTKLKLEYLRLILTFIIFIFIVTNLFFYINQVNSNWFNALSKVVFIPSLILIICIPIWMIIDLIKKKIEDKSIFNLTFFIVFVSILLYGFALIYLN